jgi:hypothetical protein
LADRILQLFEINFGIRLPKGEELYFKLGRSHDQALVTPGNQGLIFHLLSYLGETSIIADPRLIDLTIKLMSMLQHEVEFSTGFRDRD